MSHLLKYGFIICFLGGAGLLHAQSEPAFEQYQFNQLVINPAYAGSQGTLDVVAFAQRQWVNLEGAPQTESVTLNSSLNNGKIGLGAKLLHDVVGNTNKTTLAIDYAYRMYTNSGTLAIGLEASAAQYDLNFSLLDAYQNGDPAFTGTPSRFISYNAGVGLWFHSPSFYLGVSVPNILEATEANTNSNLLSNLNLFDQSQHIFLTTGYLFRMNQMVAIKPHGMLRYDLNSNLVADGSLSLIFKDALWLGGTYRSVGAFSIMGEYFFDLGNSLQDQSLGVGYAYNQRTDEIQSVFGATHEILISYQFNKKTTRFTSPRFF
jgi:type IX secretion system PorP/SprF family membrane protein